jgi:CRP-like cAMP-binding protein
MGGGGRREVKRAIASTGRPDGRHGPRVTALSRIRRRGAGEAIFSKGDSAHCVYYLLKGSVRLTGRNILELCHQSPDFGAFLMRMVAQRAALVTPPAS